jgi:hypothetical protein
MSIATDLQTLQDTFAQMHKNNTWMPKAVGCNFLEPLEEIASGGKNMNTGADHENAKARKETIQTKYNKDRMEEFLLDTLMHMQEPENDDFPEIIFVDDEPLII